MKCVALLSSLLFSLVSFAGTLVVEGTYQQKNVFVVNPIASDGVGFCVFEVTVNGLVTSDEINSQAFEVDLGIYDFTLGDDIIITIKHKDGCEPRVLNPGALEPRPTFEVTAISLSNDGLLEWKTINEQGVLPFQIQQYKWNKWVVVGEVMGKGTSTTNSYSFQTVATSGMNKFRVIQRAQDGKSKKSQPAEYINDVAPIQFSYDKKEQVVTFSKDTNFEVYNEVGQIVKKGYGKEVDAANLDKGLHYLSFDSITESFTKR